MGLSFPKNDRYDAQRSMTQSFQITTQFSPAVSLFYKYTKGPWTATPALIKAEVTATKKYMIFFQNLFNFLGKCTSV